MRYRAFYPATTVSQEREENPSTKAPHYDNERGDIVVLEEYRKHVAGACCLWIVPKPRRNPNGCAVELLKTPPVGEEEFC